jgi:transketolase
MKKDKRVFSLTADLAESLKILKVKESFPERFIDTGVAEANMAGVAAGLAIAGYIPVAGTFAVFMTRAFDHIRLQICQNNLHVILVGSHGGVSNAADGGSAHALEDFAFLRALPNMTIINPTDYNETRQAFLAAIDYPGPVYLRLYREPTAQITESAEKFIIGKARIIRKGKDITVVASGPQTAEALVVADRMSDKIDVEVISVPTIKPLDKKTILKSAKKTGRVITVEDHSINGGLGSAVAEILAENKVGKLLRLGLRQFGESGEYSALIKKVGIDSGAIIKAIRQLIKG